MGKRVLLIAMALTLVVSFGVSAAESGSAKGRYAIHNTSTDTVKLPGGGTVQVSHYWQITYAEESNHPIDNTSGDCVGVFRADASGKVTSASGSCFLSDAQGDGTSFWWRQEEAGTESCPTACGSFGYFAGDGKYKGISGKGTWVSTTAFANGSSGTWEGSFSLP